MLVKYNKVNVLHVPKVFPKGGEEHQVAHPEFVSFIPGVNTVNDKDWDLCKKHPIVMQMLDDDDLELMESKGEVTDDDKNKGGGDLANYNTKEATKVVKATANIDLLESWLALEQRKGVKDAIVAQLKKIEEETTPAE